MRLSMLVFLLAGSAWGQVPKIGDVSASGNSPSSLLVRWTTDLASSSQVKCGTTPGGPYPYLSANVCTGSGGSGICGTGGHADGVTEHAKVISQLPNPSTTYYCRPLSAAPKGKQATGPEVRATTPAALTSPPPAIQFSADTSYNDQYHGVHGLHYPSSLAINAGECVLDKGDIAICRNGSVANSWTAKVGTTTTSAFALPTDVPAAGTTWPALFLRWDGTTLDVIDSAGATAAIAKRASATYSGALGHSPMTLGSSIGGKQAFYRTISELLVWSRALSDAEMAREAAVLRSDMGLRGLVLP